MSKLATVLAAAAVLAATPPAFAAEYRLAPWKDDLFQYRNVIETRHDGRFLLVEYSHHRDLVDRDWKERVQVDPRYVSLDTQAVEAEGALEAGSVRLRYVGVGRVAGGAKAIVIFLHGRGVTYERGASDWEYGGNFNRIKNLMMRNDGAYFSAEAGDFRNRGTAAVKALVLSQAAASPGAPIFLACASASGAICWRLATDSETRGLLGGLLLLDSRMDDGFVRVAAATPPEQRIPVFIAAGDEDSIVGWRKQLRFFETVVAEVPGYPIRFVLFRSGGHATSLRMVDWRDALNWMLEVKDG